MRIIALLVSIVVLVCGACGDDGGGGPDAAKPLTWTKLVEKRPGALLGVWGSSATDVWVVGADERDGKGPLVLHYDGTAWTRLETGETSGDLWWVAGVGDTVFLGGSLGLLFKYEGGTFEKLSTPNTNIVFGIWASSPTDVWAVGGLTGGSGAFIWRYDGTTVTPMTVPSELAVGTVWKASGCGPNDVWMSATSGYVLHWDGAALTPEQLAPSTSLFSISCAGDRVIAVGGNTTNGVLYEHDGSSWTSRGPALDDPIWRGVWLEGDTSWTVGQFGAVIRRDSSGWVSDNHGLTSEGFHAAWIDPSGALWAVGGKFDRAQPIDGVLLYKGTATVPPIP